MILGYAYGDPGNKKEKKMVDLRFLNDLITKAGLTHWKATAIYLATRIGGIEIFGLPFSWAFANRKD